MTSLRYKPATGSCTLNFNKFHFNKFLSCWEPTFPWRKPTFRHQPGKTNDRCTPLCVGQARVGRGRVIERGWGRAGGKRSAGRSGHHPPARNDFDGLGFTGSRRQRANGRAVGRIGEILPNVPPPSARFGWTHRQFLRWPAAKITPGPHRWGCGDWDGAGREACVRAPAGGGVGEQEVRPDAKPPWAVRRGSVKEI